MVISSWGLILPIGGGHRKGLFVLVFCFSAAGGSPVPLDEGFEFAWPGWCDELQRLSEICTVTNEELWIFICKFRSCLLDKLCDFILLRFSPSDVRPPSGCSSVCLVTLLLRCVWVPSNFMGCPRECLLDGCGVNPRYYWKCRVESSPHSSWKVNLMPCCCKIVMSCSLFSGGLFQVHNHCRLRGTIDWVLRIYAWLDKGFVIHASPAVWCDWFGFLVIHCGKVIKHYNLQSVSNMSCTLNNASPWGADKCWITVFRQAFGSNLGTSALRPPYNS